jgi:hypothetical protein
MALATNDIDAIEQAAGEAMLAGFDGTLTLVMVLGVMFLGVDWRLTTDRPAALPADGAGVLAHLQPHPHARPIR